jgi:hypothetical protein
MSLIFGVMQLFLKAPGWPSWLLPVVPLTALGLLLGRLACIRLCLHDSGFEYHDIIGRSFHLNYSDVRALTRKSKSIGRGSYEQSTFHLRDGRLLRVNLFPFGEETYRLLQSKIGGT